MQTLIEALGEEMYAKALSDSVINIADGQALARIMRQDTVKLAFLGASISIGYHASPNGCGRCFPDFLEEYFRAAGKQVEAVNMAVSGTNCLTGIMITQLLVKGQQPDIVFVEYSINEESHPIGLEKFESLLRMLLSLEKRPVVIPVSVFNRDGYSCEEYMLHFAKMYGNPMVGLKHSLYPLIQSGKLPMNVYTEDEGHPHVDGHEFIAKAIWLAIQKSIEDGAPTLPIPEPMTDVRFEGLKLIDLEKTAPETEPCGYHEPMFPVCRKKKPGSKLVMEFEDECSQLVVMYVKNSSRDRAAVNVMCGGKRLGGFSGYSLFGWDNPWTEAVMSEPEKIRRHIILETEKGDENKQLYLIAAAYC